MCGPATWRGGRVVGIAWGYTPAGRGQRSSATDGQTLGPIQRSLAVRMGITERHCSAQRGRSNTLNCQVQSTRD